MVFAVGIESAGGGHLDGLAGAEVEAPLVERAGHDAPVKIADRERRGHVRAPICRHHDPVGRPRHQQVELGERDAPQRPGNKLVHREQVEERGCRRARGAQFAR